jgi:hypothetical protein
MSIIPWRRAHAERLAQLEQLEKEAQIARLQAETSELHARTQRETAEAELRHTEVAQLRNDIRREQIKFALDVVKVISPELATLEQVDYATRLLPILEKLLQSKLQIEGETSAQAVVSE